MKMILLRTNNSAKRNFRDSRFTTSSRYPVASNGDRPDSGEASTFDVSVVEYQNAQEFADAKRDPDNHHIPPMPMVLIQPRATSAATPADRSWGIDAVKGSSSPYTGAGVNVAVLDTGIDRSHPAFAGIELVEKNFTNEPDGDFVGHGTHCAGTIFGRDVNGVRIGIARRVTKAFIGKVLTRNGGGTTDQIVEAINWAKDAGAHIISMSLGVDFPGYREFLARERQIPSDIATSMALAGYRANIRLFDLLSRQIVESEGMRTALLVGAAGNASRREVSREFRITVEPPAAGDAFLAVAALGPALPQATNIRSPTSPIPVSDCPPREWAFGRLSLAEASPLRTAPAWRHLMLQALPRCGRSA
jgi:hypothetical protein